jgi:hypothetical protein
MFCVFQSQRSRFLSKSSHTSSSPYIHQTNDNCDKNIHSELQSILALNEPENRFCSSFKGTSSFICIFVCWVNVAEDCVLNAGFFGVAEVIYTATNKIIQ